MNFIRIFGVFMLIGALTSSCEKKKIPGPKGEPGTPGGGGNTSISHSSVFSVISAQWKRGIDTSRWEVQIPSSLINDQVVSNGSVKVYMKAESAWWELPNARGDLFTQYSFEKGFVKLEHFDIHGGLPDRPEAADYRIVTVYGN